ncbi:MAG: hypothetical protein K6A65_00320 [Succinivibrionaceae bacterium]|nr:hypothetical protein [Succinivibrionaceae bacterium]
MALKLAIYGYDTDPGRLLLEVMEERKVGLGGLFPLSPLGGEPDAVTYGGRNHAVVAVDDFDFKGADAAIFITTPDETSRVGPRATASGCLVVDCSGAQGDAVPRILPEINPTELRRSYDAGRLMVAPLTSSATALALILSPLHVALGLRGASATVLESLSEQGRFGVETLSGETIALLNGCAGEHEGFPAQVAFNVHARIGDLAGAGRTVHEAAIEREVRSLMGDFPLGLSVTVLQVPTFYGHTLTVRAELEDETTAEEVADILGESEHLELRGDDEILTSVDEGVGHDRVSVSRLRLLGGRTLELVAMIDNTRRGMAISCARLIELASSFLGGAEPGGKS